MAVTEEEEAAEYKRQWIAFPNAPGTRLSWRRVKWRTWELVPQSSSVWATLHPEGRGHSLGLSGA